MKFELKTHDIQLLTIAVIEAMCDGSDLHKKWKDDFISLRNIFVDMNKMCVEENGYTVTVSVEG